MNEHPQIPAGYMQNATGSLIPETKVKDEDKLEDELVRKLTRIAAELSLALTTFKAQALSEAVAFKYLVNERYGATKGGAKGNMTLRAFDGSAEMQIAVAEHIAFGPELNAAKELIDNCVRRWSQDANDNTRVLVEHAFQVNKTGKIDTQRVLGLRRLEINDAEWSRAMDAISDAVRVTGSKTYVRFYEIDAAGNRHAIALDLASV